MIRPVAAWWQRLQQRLRRAATETHTVSGFPVDVENTRFDVDTGQVLARLGEALDLIARFDQRRLRRLRQDVRRFRVMRYPCRGAFFADGRVCMVELTFLARTDITAAQVAACIVHEGAHARVHGAHANRRATSRAPEERFCRRAEVAFARTLPADLAAPLIERAAAVLEGSDEDAAPDTDWAEAVRRQRAADIGALTIPTWLKRALLRRVRRAAGGP